MRKVFQLSKFYKPFSGGLESVVADISEGIAKESIVFVAAADPEGHCKYEEINGVNVIRSRELFSVASTSISFAYIMDVIKVCSKKLIHVHYPNPLANIALVIARLCFKDISNLVIHWHSDIVKQKKILFFYKPLLNWSLKKAKVIIVTSENYLKHSEQLKAFRYKCVVVPIGIDSITEKVNATRVMEIKESFPGKKLIFSLGRHTYYKGFEYLIEAAKELKDSVVLIGGKGRDTEKYKKLIKSKNLENTVHLLGKISDEDLPSYYAAADVFCLPSIEKSEAFGVVQLEAMSVGTPIICADIEGSGVPWVNKHMDSGLVCMPKDSKSLAYFLNKILLENGLRETLAQGALKRFNSYFTKDKMVKEVRRIYSSFEE